MDYCQEYKKLDKVLRKQISKVSHLFNNDRNVKTFHNHLLSHIPANERNDEKIRKQLFRLAIYKKMKPEFFLTENFIDMIICYSSEGPILPLNKLMESHRHSILFEGKLSDLPVVVKWYYSSKRDCNYELDIYKRLSEMNCDLPWFSDKFQIWGFPVLVLEKLHPLSRSDDEYKMGISVIQQLTHLHQFAVHCDIKPGNVMRRVVGSSVTYLLIDYGGVATERLKHGYKRWLWSPKWTSQPEYSHEDRDKDARHITTAKNDFLELGYTMKAIQNWRIGKGNGECKSGFTGRLKRYMVRVKQIDSHKITHKDYDDLLSILSK